MSPHRAAAVRIARLPGPIRGAFWMTVACGCLGSMNVLVRYVSAEVHPFEIAFFRNLGQLVFLLPWLMGNGLPALRTRRLKTHVVRAFTGLAAMLSWFSALSLMPVAEATALSFTAPVILGETVRLRRWSATLIGFVGALVILRPGVAEFSWPAVLALVAAALMAVSALFIKSLSRDDSPTAIAFHMALMMTPLSLLPALMVWEMPSPEMLGWLVVLGATATVAHLGLNLAFAAADASAVLPYDFIRLPVAAALAYLAFGELPDAFTWIGAGVIFAATLYITHREARLGRVRATAPAPAIAAAEPPRPEPRA
jgi:drug/metabolite transporter (DMT)-like permease